LQTIYESGLLQTWMDVPQKLYRITLKSLSELDDQSFLHLRHNSALPIVFAHIFSQNRVGRIKELAQERQQLGEQSSGDDIPGTVEYPDHIFRFST